MKRSNTQLTTQSAYSYGSKRSRARSGSTTVIKRRVKNSGITKFPGYGFPTKLNAKLRYVDTFALNAVAGGLSTQQIRCNGMYDPDHSGLGHQPMYYDQLLALYDHYTVLRSRIKLTIFNFTTEPSRVNIYLNDDATVTPTDMNSRMEQSSARNIIVSKEGGPVVLYLSWDAYKTFGGSILGNDNLQGTSGADPVELSLYTITAQNTALTSATSVGIQAEIVFDVVFDELKDIQGS